MENTCICYTKIKPDKQINKVIRHNFCPGKKQITEYFLSPLWLHRMNFSSFSSLVRSLGKIELWEFRIVTWCEKTWQKCKSNGIKYFLSYCSFSVFSLGNFCDLQVRRWIFNFSIFMAFTKEICHREDYDYESKRNSWIILRPPPITLIFHHCPHPDWCVRSLAKK